jgi:hypothetical protein
MAAEESSLKPNAFGRNAMLISEMGVLSDGTYPAANSPTACLRLRALSGSMHERPWWAVQHNLLGTVRRVRLDEYARQNALRAGAVQDPFDFRLTRGETSGAILRV